MAVSTDLLYVTYVEAYHGLLRIWGQPNRTCALYIEKQLVQLTPELNRSPGLSPSRIQKGMICLAKQEDETYYRVRIMSDAMNNAVIVFFIDLGYQDMVDLSLLRMIASPNENVISTIVPQADQYYLANIKSEGGWSQDVINEIRHGLCYSEHKYRTVCQSGHDKLIQIIYRNEDYSGFLIRQEIATPVSVKEQMILLKTTFKSQTMEPLGNPLRSTYFNQQPPQQSNRDKYFIQNKAQLTAAVHDRSSQPGPPNSQPLLSHAIFVQPQARPNGDRHFNVNASKKPGFGPTSNTPALPEPKSAVINTVVIEALANQLKQHLLKDQLTPQIPEASGHGYVTQVLDVKTTHNVYISYIDDGPWAFSVQLVSNEHELNQLMEDLASHNFQPIKLPLILGSACIAKSHKYDSYCRGVLVNITHSAVKVFYVDFGNTEDLPYNMLFEIPPKFFKYKTMSQKFALSGLQRVKPTEEIKRAFIEVVENELLILHVTNLEGENLPTCDLYLKDVNIKKILNEKLRLVKNWEPIQFPRPGEIENVFVTWVETPQRFFVQLKRFESELRELKAELASFGGSSECLDSEDILPGSICISYFAREKTWYRAVITAVNTTKMVTVFYVDYGYTEMVDIRMLKKVVGSVIPRIKVQAIPCCLHGFEGGARQSSKSALTELILGKEFSLKVVSEGNERINVQLFDNGKDVLLGFKNGTVQCHTLQPKSPSHDTKGKPDNYASDSDSVKKKNILSAKATSDKTESNKSRGKKDTKPEKDKGDLLSWRTEDRRESGPKQKDDGKNNKANNGKEWAWDMKTEKYDSRRGDDSKADDSRTTRYGFKGKKENGRDAKNVEKNWRGTENVGSKTAAGDGGKKPRMTESINDRMKRAARENEERGRRISDAEITRLPVKLENMAFGGKIAANKEIKSGTVEEVIITYFVSPQEIYLQLTSCREKFQEFMADIADYYSTKLPMLNKPKKGDIVMCKFQLDGILYRAVVIESNPITVQYVDFGNEEVSDRENLWPMDKRFLDLESQCHKCVIPNIRPAAAGIWPESNPEMDNIFAQEIYTCTFLKLTEHGYEVKLVTEDGKDVREELISAGIACPLEESVEDPVKVPKEDPVKVPKEDPVKVPKEDSVKVPKEDSVKVPEQGSVKVPKEDSVKVPEQGSVKISEKDSVKIPKEDTVKMPEQDPAKVPEKSSVKISKEDTVKMPEQDPAKVPEKSSVKAAEKDSIKVPKEDTVKMPEQDPAKVPEKDSVKAPEKDSVKVPEKGSIKVPKEDSVKVPEQDSVKVPEKDSIKAPKEDPMQGSVQDSLQISTQDSAQSSASVEDSSQGAVEHPVQVPVKDSLYTAVQDSVQEPIHTFAQDQFPISVLDSAVKRMPVTKEIPLPLIKIKNCTKTPFDLVRNEVFNIYVTHIVDVSEFYIQITCSETKGLERDILKFVEGEEFRSCAGRVSVANGNLCLVQVDNKSWHRGQVIEKREQQIIVSLIDLGYTLTVNREQLGPISEQLAEYRPLAIRCCLLIHEDKPIDVLNQEFLLCVKNNYSAFFHEKSDKGFGVTLYDGYGEKLKILNRFNTAPVWIRAISDLPVIKRRMQVVVSHIDSPKEVYVQLLDDIAELKELISLMMVFYSDESVPKLTGDLSEFEMYAVKSLTDNTWYRAQLMSQNEKAAKMFYLDFGRWEEVPRENLRKLDPSFYECYAYAKKISLNLFYPRTTEKRLSTKLQKMIGKKVCPAYFMRLSDTLYAEFIVDDSFLTSHLVSGSVRILMDDMFEKYKNKVSEEEIKVYVSHVNNPGEFWVHDENVCPELTAFQDKIQEACINGKPKKEVLIGDIVGAMFKDNLWYRALIKNVEGDSVSIRFLDYGNAFEMNIKENVFISLPDELKKRPSFARRCSLQGTWKKNATYRFEDIVLNNNETFELVEIDDEGDIVDLMHDGSSVTEQLIIEGYEGPENEDVVFITHINSPSEFYIQRENDQDLFDMVIEKMVGADLLQDPYEVILNELYCARFPEDDLWYRARVLCKDKEEVVVSFIDYGNCSVVTEIKELPDDLKALRPLSMNCCLVNVREKDTWSEAAKNYLWKFLNNVPLKMELVQQTSGVNVVRLTTEDGEDLGDMLTAIEEGLDHVPTQGLRGMEIFNDENLDDLVFGQGTVPADRKDSCPSVGGADKKGNGDDALPEKSPNLSIFTTEAIPSGWISQTESSSKEDEKSECSTKSSHPEKVDTADAVGGPSLEEVTGSDTPKAEDKPTRSSSKASVKKKSERKKTERKTKASPGTTPKGKARAAAQDKKAQGEKQAAPNVIDTAAEEAKDSTN